MDFHRSRTIKSTRKEHRCFGCLEMIPKGSQAQHDTGRIGGDFYSSYLCSLCVEYVSKYDDYADVDGYYREGDIGIARQERKQSDVSV
jgi:hypothetical protein